MCVCKATGRVSELLPFIYPFLMFLTPRPYCEFRCERTQGLWQKNRSFHIFIWQVLWICLHTHWAHGSSLPWKGSMFIQNGNVLPSLSPSPSSVLVLHFSRRTQSRTVRHDTWERVRMDAPLFSPVLTSFFPSLIGTFSTGSKPTGRLVCVHGVLLSPLPLGIEPKALFIRCLESPHPSQIPKHSP